MSVTKEFVARTAHEVLRAYCEALGNTSLPVWEEAPGYQVADALAGVELHWVGNVSPEYAHNAWVGRRMAEGWEYGPNESKTTRTHPALMPFDQLPPADRLKPILFRAVVRALRPARGPTQHAVVPGIESRL